MKKQKYFIAELLSFIIFFFMILIAVITNEKEIIFPEAAALCAGALLAPTQPWQVSKPRFVAIMTVCAVFGLLLSLSPFALIVKIMLGFVAAVCCILLFRCSLVPAISACVLPVIMNTQSIIYPISVFCLALCTVLFQLFLEKAGLRKVKVFTKTEPLNKKTAKHWALMFICLLVYSIYPIISGNILLIAPPLIVMFCELLSPERKFFRKEHIICIFVIICSFTGAALNFAAVQLGFSIILCSALVSAIIIILMTLTKIYFPPAAALAFLPFIISTDLLLLYPVFVLVTAIIISCFSYAVNRHAFSKEMSDIFKK